MTQIAPQTRDRWIYLALTLAVLAVYGQVNRFGFVNYDDPSYVQANPVVQRGFSFGGVAWAFTTGYASNWHPLTWLSHMLDCQLFGLNPMAHHLTNLLLHIANSLLLFYAFQRMTGATWRCAAVAGLFALHPLHVESVAWISERKDVLSALFWMLTLLAYVRYVERPAFSRYGLMLFLFALGLMAKPMVVTLPFVLLLLDYWPLNRLPITGLGEKQRRVEFIRRIVEKVPLFVLTAVSSVITFVVQHREGAVTSIGSLPLHHRIANALVSYVSYVGKMFWPSHLSVLYPYENHLPLWRVAGSGLILVIVTVFVMRTSRLRPYLLVGWLWYLGTLVPVIGLVQVGEQAMADRYTYLPLVGLFLMATWGVGDLMERWRHRNISLSVSCAVLFAALMACSWLEVRHWKTSVTLFEHTLKVTTNNAVVHYLMGITLAAQGKADDAMDHYIETLRIEPDYEKAHYYLAIALASKGRTNEAIDHYVKAIQIKPDFVEALTNLGIVLESQGKNQDAIACYREAVQRKPEYALAHYNLGLSLAIQGKYQDAIAAYTNALRIEPNMAEAHNNLGQALATLGKTAEAIAQCTKAVRLKPDYEKAHYNLGVLLAAQGMLPEAIAHYSEAVRLRPDYAEAHSNLGLALLQQGKVADAIEHCSNALRIRPNYEKAHFNLGLALAAQGKTDEAIAQLKEAVRIKPSLLREVQNRFGHDPIGRAFSGSSSD